MLRFEVRLVLSSVFISEFAVPHAVNPLFDQGLHLGNHVFILNQIVVKVDICVLANRLRLAKVLRAAALF